MATDTKRVRFVKHADLTADYVDARFDVLLDGVKVGEVTANEESVETARSAMSNSRLAQYRTAKVWCSEVPGRSTMDRRNRTDAAVDLLQHGAGLSYIDARIAVTGKAF